MSRIALTTVGMLRAARGDLQVQEFFDRLAGTYDTAEDSEGFIGRSKLDVESGKHSWGELIHPRFYRPNEHSGVAFTLSLWTSMEAASAFAYAGVHGEALSHRLEWFVPPEWPSYAAWWVSEVHTPDWREATERIEHLHDHGPTSFSFTFKSSFGPNGDPANIDRSLVREIVDRAKSRRERAA